MIPKIKIETPPLSSENPGKSLESVEMLLGKAEAFRTSCGKAAIKPGFQRYVETNA
jgi:hypothetical protein